MEKKEKKTEKKQENFEIKCFFSTLYNKGKENREKILKIETKRLKIRPFKIKEKYIEMLFHLWTDESLFKYVDNVDIETKEDAKHTIIRFIEEYDSCGTTMYCVKLKKEKKLIGGVGVWPILSNAEGKKFYCSNKNKQNTELNLIYECGFFIDPKYWKMGFGNECVCSFLKGTRKMDKNVFPIFSYVHPKNKASIKILIKNGFIKDKQSVSTEDQGFTYDRYKLVKEKRTAKKEDDVKTKT